MHMKHDAQLTKGIHFVHNTSSMEVIHVTFGIQKLLVGPEVKIYDSLHGPGRIYRWRPILSLMNPWLITLPAVVACSDNVSR